MKYLTAPYKFLLISLVLFCFSACSENFLNEKPLGEPSSATLFADEEGAVRATNGIYAHLRSWPLSGFSYFGIKVVASDNADPGSVPGDGLRLRAIDNFTYTPTTTELNGYWSGNYVGINRANQVIYNIPDIEMDEDLKARLIGEAKFLRALFYFNLALGFGDVPLIDKVYTDPLDARKAVPKSSQEEIFDFIIKNLEAAIAVLPLKSEYPPEDLGRATKGAAQGLLAKVYLFKQDYANAHKYALAVIQSHEYSLYPDYSEVFLPDQENGSGSIFEAQFIARDDRAILNEYVKWQGIRTIFGWGFNSPSEDLSDAYEKGDPRREATIFYDGETLQGFDHPFQFPVDEGAMPRANQKVMLPKNMQPAGYPANSPTNRIILRYADILLICAEAANELGQTTEALKYLNMVRERARGGDPNVLPDITETNKMQLRHLIWHERRVELAMEGKRFFNLIREDKVEPGRAEKILHTQGKTLFDIKKHGTFPVPQQQVDISGGILKQDPEW